MKICFVSSGFEDRNRFLQPWCYLVQGAQALSQGGHQVSFISDGYPRFKEESEFLGFPVKRINTLQELPLLGNKNLARTVNEQHPDLVLWHLGLTSFLHLSTLDFVSSPIIGIFTSPIYKLSELLQLGALRLLRNHGLSSVHAVGLLVPAILIQQSFKHHRLRNLVVESQTTRDKLKQRGVPEASLCVIRPHIDPSWFHTQVNQASNRPVREKFGFAPDDFVVGYFGAPAPLRGIQALLLAGKLAMLTNPSVRLLVLSRVLDEEDSLENDALVRMIKDNDLERQVRIVPGMLSREQLILNLSICDAVALPFELVPSDVPLSILEVMALGIPLITSDVGCIPEMVPEGTGIKVHPRNISLLSEAIITLAGDKQLRQKLAKMGREQALAWSSINDNHQAWNTLVNETT